MSEQNYSNHKKYVPGYHFVTFSIVMLLFFLSLYSLYNAVSSGSGILVSVIFVLISVLFISLFFYLRAFALKAQDRAIRAEERFRYYLLTGKMIDSRITMPQILSLRFAPDDELEELTIDATEKNLSADEIKKRIKNWKADNYRL